MVFESFSVYKGATCLKMLTVVEEDGGVYDLTGASVWLTVKEVADTASNDLAALFQLTVGDGLTVSAPATGVVAVEISSTRTDTLTAGRTYKYDVQVRKSSKTFPAIEGRIGVRARVTMA